MVNRLFEQLLGDGTDLPSLSPKEEVILSLLSGGRAMYGLEIVSKSEGGIGRGTVYVTLSRIEEKGFVESRQEEQPPGAKGLPRRLYRITGEGSRVLRGYRSAALAFRAKVPA